MGGQDCFKYEVRQTAYIKLVLHALNHKTSSVNGILLGRLLDDRNTVEIADAVPLSHSQIGLLPTLEIALTLIEEHFAVEGLSIVGYYHANERYEDHELGSIARKIGDHIFRYFPQAALLLLDNRKLEALPKGSDRNPVVQLYTRDASKTWRQAGSDASSSQLALKEPSANIVLLDYISTEKWRQIVDFDDHLEDISKDWLNSDLFN
ncbi:ER membrane protein complex subunit 8/9 homolog [Magnolia sinica]|uniref:ER membrane protein complex subunit 8/9 homolog n=1 Tax=Magnolia sinica TaxID=86752 RepID=UPI00265A6D44|nr:ER membrane protein complex subunit 8/9 homolog [Magnolia sinica]